MRSTSRCSASLYWKSSRAASRRDSAARPWRRAAAGARSGAALWLALLALAAPSAAESGDPRQEARSGFAVDPERGSAVYADDAIPLRVRARGLLATDVRDYDDRNARRSGLRLDRALVGVQGEAFDRIEFRVLADLRGIDTRYGLEEAWLSTELLQRRLRLTGGVLRVPLGIEHSFPEETLAFVDYAHTAFLTGRTDLGVGVDGEFAEGLFSYAVNGSAGEGFDLHGNRRGDAQLTARVVAYPFRPVDLALALGVYEIPVVSGIFVSAAGSHSWGFSGPIEYATSLRNQLVTTSRIEADRTWTFHLGYGLDLGPIRIVHEFARQSLLGVDLPDGTSRDFEGQNATWSASIEWRVTGEPYDSRPYRQREHPVALPATPLYRDGAWGPGTIEIAVRYANAEIDRDLIDLGFTSAAIGGRPSGISSQESRAFDVAVNWIPFTPVRLTFQLTRTLADQRPASFDSHGRDTSYLVRLQLSF